MVKQKSGAAILLNSPFCVSQKIIAYKIWNDTRVKVNKDDVTSKSISRQQIGYKSLTSSKGSLSIVGLFKSKNGHFPVYPRCSKTGKKLLSNVLPEKKKPLSRVLIGAYSR